MVRPVRQTCVSWRDGGSPAAGDRGLASSETQGDGAALLRPRTSPSIAIAIGSAAPGNWHDHLDGRKPGPLDGRRAALSPERPTGRRPAALSPERPTGRRPAVLSPERLTGSRPEADSSSAGRLEPTADSRRGQRRVGNTPACTPERAGDSRPGRSMPGGRTAPADGSRFSGRRSRPVQRRDSPSRTNQRQRRVSC